MPNLQKEEVKYKEFYDQYHAYMRSVRHKRYTNIFIPKGTPMLVWYEMWQYNDDMTDFTEMWRKWEKTFYIPNGIARWDTHISNKDVTIPMVLVSYRNEKGVPESRIITDLYGEVWPIREGEYTAHYGLWIKMYEKPTYIPELGTSIVAYGVFEENLPMVNDCFKYGNMKHGIGPLPYYTTQSVRVDPLSTKGQALIDQYTTNSNSVIYNPATPPKGLGNGYTGKVYTPTIVEHFTERARLDNDGNYSYNWICTYCGGDTSRVEYDYLGSGTNHLSCELHDNYSNNRFILEN